jgi:hypothetical protein
VKAAALRVDAQHARRRRTSLTMQAESLLHNLDAIIERHQFRNVFASQQ